MRKAERAVTYSLMNSYRNQAGGIEGSFQLVFFGWTSEWGCPPHVRSIFSRY